MENSRTRQRTAKSRLVLDCNNPGTKGLPMSCFQIPCVFVVKGTLNTPQHDVGSYLGSVTMFPKPVLPRVCKDVEAWLTFGSVAQCSALRARQALGVACETPQL